MKMVKVTEIMSIDGKRKNADLCIFKYLMKQNMEEVKERATINIHFYRQKSKIYQKWTRKFIFRNCGRITKRRGEQTCCKDT